MKADNESFGAGMLVFIKWRVNNSSWFHDDDTKTNMVIAPMWLEAQPKGGPARPAIIRTATATVHLGEVAMFALGGGFLRRFG